MNDQEIDIINTSTRNEQLKKFFQNKFKSILVTTLLLLILIFSYLFFNYQKENKKKDISNTYNELTLSVNKTNQSQKLTEFKSIILAKDKTYSPLALYYLIDNEMIENVDEINLYFDLVINDLGLNKDLKYLNIYKKALYNSQYVKTDELIEMLKPIIENENVWKSHGLFLIAENLISIGRKEESKQYYKKIVEDIQSNKNIKLEAQKRIQRDLGD